MFAPDAPPLSWDGSGDYARGRLELYYLAYAAAALGPGCTHGGALPHAPN